MAELEEGMVRIPIHKDILRDIVKVARKIGVSPESVIMEAALRYIDSWDTDEWNTWEFKWGFESGYRCGYTEAWHDKKPQQDIPMFLADEYAAAVSEQNPHYRKAWNDFSVEKAHIHYSIVDGKIERKEK